MIVTDVYTKVDELARIARQSKYNLSLAIANNVDSESLAILEQRHQEDYKALENFLNSQVEIK